MHQDLGIIIKKTDFREADRIYTFYSKDFGKIKILAKGVRKINAKLRSPLDLLNYVEFSCVYGKTFRIITGVDLITGFPKIKTDIEKLKAGYYIIYLVNELIRGEEKDEKVWKLLLGSLINLNILKTVNLLILKLLLRYFELNLLKNLGLKPQLHSCITCQKKLKPEKLYFSPKEGGIICKNCFKKDKDYTEIAPNTIKVLRILLEKDWKYVQRLKLGSKELESLAQTFQQLINYID